ncbi:MaoC family dehydratase [Chloroflexota bacterium]
MLPEKIKNLTGQVYSTNTFDIDKESVKRFAYAVGDLNPLYHNASYAEKSPYRSIIAPPGFISSIWFWEDGSQSDKEGKKPRSGGLLDLIFSIAEAGYPSAIDSGIDYEFLEPVKAGDTITSTLVIKDIKERKSEDGNIVFLITNTSYENQDGRVVANVKMTTIHR